MNKIKTVGIVGLGGVGISIAYLLQQNGLKVIGFKPPDKQLYFETLMKTDRIRIRNQTSHTALKTEGTLQIQLTSRLSTLVDHSDLILNCCQFPQSSEVYQFNKNQLALIAQKNIPVIAFPGQLGSTWFISKEHAEVGLIADAPIFVTLKEVTSPVSHLPTLLVDLLDFKSKIAFGYDNTEKRSFLIDFFNKALKTHRDYPTFVDGYTTLQTALNSPVPAINACAICQQAQRLISLAGESFQDTIYALNENYAQLFQEIFDEQINVAHNLQLFHTSSLTEWLSNRMTASTPSTISKMLQKVYAHKLVTISGNDRRIYESYHALLFFRAFANTLQVQVPATEMLLTQLRKLHQALPTSCRFQDLDNRLQREGYLYAHHVQYFDNQVFI